MQMYEHCTHGRGSASSGDGVFDKLNDQGHCYACQRKISSTSPLACVANTMPLGGDAKPMNTRSLSMSCSAAVSPGIDSAPETRAPAKTASKVARMCGDELRRRAGTVHSNETQGGQPNTSAFAGFRVTLQPGD